MARDEREDQLSPRRNSTASGAIFSGAETDETETPDQADAEAQGKEGLLNMITAEEARALIDYDPDTGVFRWRRSRRGCRIGDVAGNPNSKGYWQISLNYKRYFGHRLAWLYVHGYWPTGEIDHINMDKGDNRICNLRDATREQNRHNTTMTKRNTTGFKGVSFHRKMGKFQAHHRRHWLGYFQTAEAAHAAYAKAATEAAGEFARIE